MTDQLKVLKQKMKEIHIRYSSYIDYTNGTPCTRLQREELARLDQQYKLLRKEYNKLTREAQGGFLNFMQALFDIDQYLYRYKNNPPPNQSLYMLWKHLANQEKKLLEAVLYFPHKPIRFLAAQIGTNPHRALRFMATLTRRQLVGLSEQGSFKRYEIKPRGEKILRIGIGGYN